MAKLYGLFDTSDKNPLETFAGDSLQAFQDQPRVLVWRSDEVVAILNLAPGQFIKEINVGTASGITDRRVPDASR